MNKLPDLPSQLLKVAADDVQKCLDLPEIYVVDMQFWHWPLSGLCHICVAGAVMAQSLRIDSELYTVPSMNDADSERKLNALNLFRQGCYSEAFSRLNIPFPIARLPQTVSGVFRNVNVVERLNQMSKELQDAGF